MQITKKQLSSMGIDLPPGRYTAEQANGFLEVYKCGGDTEGCILVGTGRMKAGVVNSRFAMTSLMKQFEAEMALGNKLGIEIR